MCKYWMGRDEEALDICMRFLETFPDSRWAPGVRFWLGTFHHNAGRFEKAMELFLSFADRYPSHALADDAVLWAGICAARNKDYLGSIELLNRLVKEYPGSEKLAEARFAQADSLTQLARYAAAILIYDEIIAKYPGRELVPAAWGRKGDCQFTLGAEDPSRYRESMESYRVVVNNARADVELVLQAEYKIGRCHEKLGRPMEAFEHYYLRVLLPFLQRQEAGEWIGDAAKVWFTRAAFAAAAIMEQQEDWRRAVSILKRVVDAEVPAADEARERIRRIRSERWWLF
jgi:tetratricopeptide (TPR) repeat protein